MIFFPCFFLDQGWQCYLQSLKFLDLLCCRSFLSQHPDPWFCFLHINLSNWFYKVAIWSELSYDWQQCCEQECVAVINLRECDSFQHLFWRQQMYNPAKITNKNKNYCWSVKLRWITQGHLLCKNAQRSWTRYARSPQRLLTQQCWSRELLQSQGRKLSTKQS